MAEITDAELARILLGDKTPPTVPQPVQSIGGDARISGIDRLQNAQPAPVFNAPNGTTEAAQPVFQSDPDTRGKTSPQPLTPVVLPDAASVINPDLTAAPPATGQGTDVSNIAGALNAQISGAGTTPAAAASPGGFAQLLQNPLFLSFLADLGTRTDPTGVGGIVGGATKTAIKAKSLAEALGKSSRNRSGNMAAIIGALGADSNTLNNIKFNPDGSIASIGSTGVKTPSDTMQQPINQQQNNGGSPVVEAAEDTFNTKADQMFIDLGL